MAVVIAGYRHHPGADRRHFGRQQCGFRLAAALTEVTGEQQRIVPDHPGQRVDHQGVGVKVGSREDLGPSGTSSPASPRTAPIERTMLENSDP